MIEELVPLSNNTPEIEKPNAAVNRDGFFRLTIDKKGEWATVDAWGSIGSGAPLYKNKIVDQLRYENVLFGIDEDAVARVVLASETGDRLVKGEIVAKMLKPENGSNSEIRFIVSPEIKKLYNETKTGQIDYRNKSNLIKIAINTTIAEFFPATLKGRSGYDIFGTEIPASDGVTKELKCGDGIIAEKQSSGSILFKSKIDGHLVYLKASNFIDVKNILSLEKIDIHSGNIQYKGNVEIGGDIETNMVLSIDGDLHVSGHIFGAEVKVTGNIHCEKGINGMFKGKIIAGGEIHTHYIENALIYCEGNVIVENSIVNSKLYLNGELTLSNNKSKIIGGEICVAKSMCCYTMGNEMGKETTVYLGVNYITQKSLREKSKELKNIRELIVHIDIEITKLVPKDKNVAALTEEQKKEYLKLLFQKSNYFKIFNAIKTKVGEIKNKMVNDFDSSATVLTKLFSGIRFCTEGDRLVIENSHTNCKIVRKAGSETLEISKNEERKKK